MSDGTRDKITVYSVVGVGVAAAESYGWGRCSYHDSSEDGSD